MRIAVVGAGIGGLAAAIFLKQQSHDITVFEAFPSPRPLGAGLLLQPPGQTVLKLLGIGKDALKMPLPSHVFIQPPKLAANY